ncbi:probable F420-dependent oxidoreductase, Rv2161c family [Pseudonocardia thermophila]|uniref:Probable F420-dependent oxidoreductase, Rv2161c family n=1 Tax=Pseudonocardia thermophila TaxID=1848 RepID=A0A1M6P4U9_PSETH|nr:TIGR03619 family F420-dependent LLM class oxidoreductase [Pseudonocardia thermophila]SHK02916.1 probable F420-dependent oxidoreductase, Rv2161c family [Pseudonocardia thermophila]
MKFGTTIMGLSLRKLPELAAAYEENGFESVWMPEHLVFPADPPTTYPYSPDGHPPFQPRTPVYDVWVLFGFLAAATSRIRFATNVYVLPLRHPLQTARSVVTLDRVTRGRVTLGVGVGWLADEFTYLGLPFADRGRRTDAAIDAIRRLWREERIEVHDEFFDFGPVAFEPKPIRPEGIPIEVGGVSRRALRRAGARGDGWIEVGCTDVAEVKEKLDVVMEARRAAGRTGPFEVTLCGELAFRPDLYAELADLGVTRVVVDPRRDLGERLELGATVDWAKRFADDVISRHT